MEGKSQLSKIWVQVIEINYLAIYHVRDLRIILL